MKKEQRKFIRIVIYSFIIGFIIEKLLTFIWGYNNHIKTYILGVPIFIVFTWVIGLTLGYYIIDYVSKKSKISITFTTLLVYLPLIIILEYIGSQILEIRLNEYYPSLISSLGIMEAPVGIYFIYLIVALIFFNYISSNRKV